MAHGNVHDIIDNGNWRPAAVGRDFTLTAISSAAGGGFTHHPLHMGAKPFGVMIDGRSRWSLLHRSFPRQYCLPYLFVLDLEFGLLPVVSLSIRRHVELLAF